MSHELYACRGARSEIGRDYHARDSAGMYTANALSHVNEDVRLRATWTLIY